MKVGSSPAQPILLFLSTQFLFFLSYLIGLGFTVTIVHQPWHEVVVFPPEPFGSLGLLVALGQGAVFLGAVGLIWLVPGIPLALAFAPSRWSRLTILVVGSLINFGLMVGITTLLKLVGYIPLTRIHFLMSWGVCLVAGMLIGFQRRHALTEAIQRTWPTRYHWRMILLAALLALLVGIIGYPKLVIENFNGDGTEIFSPAQSLLNHFLPSWDLGRESRLGLIIVPPLWSYHYLMLPWLLLLGPSEAAVRLPLLGYLPLLFIAVTTLIREETHPVSRSLQGFLWMATLYVTTLFLYYGGYDPYLADASYGISCLFLGLLVVLQFYCLKKRQGWLLITLALLGMTTRYWVFPISLILLGVAWCRMSSLRAWLSRVFVRFAATLVCVAFVIVGIGWHQGILELWIADLVGEYSHSLRWPWERPSDLARHLFQWTIQAGILPLGSLIYLRRLPPTGQILALTTVAFGGLLAFVSQDRTFYERTLLGLLTIVTAGYWLRQMSVGHERIFGVLATAVLSLLTFLVFPKSLNIGTASREFGIKTCMLFPSYEEAMNHSRIAIELFEQKRMGWYIDYPAWVHYSTITERPTRPFHYYLSSQPTPPTPEAVLVATSREKSFFFAANREAAQALRDWTPPHRPHLKWLHDSG